MSDHTDYFAWADETFRLDRVFAKPEPLRGVRVLELAILYLGPVTAALTHPDDIDHHLVH